MKNDEKNNMLEMKTYQCSFCPVAFDQKDFLSKHIQSHEEENGTLLVKDNEEKKPHVCEICMETFTQESDYAVHLCNH